MALSKIDPNSFDVNSIGQYGGRRNLIINGAMQVAQRGTSVTVNSTSSFSSPDRFRFQQNANTNSTIEQSTDVPSGEGFKYSTKITNGTAETRNGTDFGRLYYRAEGYDSNHLELGTSSAKAFVLSFWVKSSLTGTFGVGFALDTTGLLSSSYTIDSADTWEHKTITVSAGTFTGGSRSSTTGIGLQVHWDMGEGPDRSQSTGFYSSGSPSHMGLTGGVKFVETTGATFYITGVQIEIGDTATPFEHRSYGEELALCQRYCRFWTYNSLNHDRLPSAGGFGGAIFIMYEKMRAAPSASWSSLEVRDTSNIAQTINSASTTAENGSQFILAAGNGGGGTFRFTASGGYLKLDAEL